MLAYFNCLNLKITWIEKSVTSISNQISQFNFNSRQQDKFKFALELIRLPTISNVCPLQAVPNAPTLPTLCTAENSN